jgi:hypothetical protein
VQTGIDSLFCDDLPTRPDRAAGRILVTGASGYAGGRLTVAASYDTGSIWGKLYWYASLPFQRYVFKGLIEEIEARAGI